MKYATIQEVKEETSFSDVSSLSDERLQSYIRRAERWIHRITNNRFENVVDSDILFDLQRAVVLIVDYLWYHDQEEIQEDYLDPIQSERIGSYSYTKADRPDIESNGFGNPELDSILSSLKVEPKVSFFVVSGPSKRKP